MKMTMNWKRHAPTALLLVVAAVLFFKHGQWACAFLPDYQTFAVSDWFINYEAGFVRRGLLGQLLYEAYQVSAFNVRVFILSLPFVFSPLLLALLLWVFRQEHWPPTVLFTSCCLGATFLTSDVRRDYLVLIMVFFIFLLATRWLHRRHWPSLCVFMLLSVTLLLTYEPAAFIAFPLLFVVLFKRQVFLPVFPIALVGLVVFTSKGDPGMAQAIWQSWEPCLRDYRIPNGHDGIGLGVAALGWDMLETFLFHLRLAYIGFSPSLLTVPLIVYMLAGTYYLVVCLEVPQIPFWPATRGSAAMGGQASSSARGLSNVLLLQFLFMLPMFTVLSCDWGRNITLCTVSAFFLMHFFPDAAGVAPPVDRVTTSLLTVIDRYRLLRSPVFYAFVALTVPMPLSEAPHLEDSMLGILLTLIVGLIHF